MQVFLALIMFQSTEQFIVHGLLIGVSLLQLGQLHLEQFILLLEQSLLLLKLLLLLSEVLLHSTHLTQGV